MPRGLGLVGLIVLGFGLGSYYAAGEPGRFAQAHLAAAAVLLLAAGAASLRRLRGLARPAGRRLLARRALSLLALLALAGGLEYLAQRLDLRFDWTLDRRFQPAPATLAAMADLAEPTATLYYDERDPRARSTRLLLQVLAEDGRLRVHEALLDESIADIERFEVTTSNSVVIEAGDRFELVERPTEGTLWEAFERLRQRGPRTVVYFSRGAGEGDPLRADDGGFSGAAVALATEGYAVRDLVLAAAQEVPADARVLVVAAPERGLRPESVALLDAWLGAGGSLAVLVEPGFQSGLEPMLARWGFALPDGVVVDPASGPLEGSPAGVNPLAYAYADHPVAHGLEANRMTLFLGARPTEPVRKPDPEDALQAVVFSSPRAWLAPDLDAIRHGRVTGPESGETRRFPMVAAGRYPRPAGEARIVVFGDRDFASNRYLRTLYNLDLWMNAMHWLAEREPSITLRPKALTPNQTPLTPQESLAMLYGVGLLLPELFLIAAVLAWVRRRTL